MKPSKSMMALEDLGEDTGMTSEELLTVDAAIDAEHAETVAELTEIGNDADRVQETESIATAVRTSADALGEDIAREEPLTEGGVRQIEAAMEHYRLRTGYAKAVVPSLEGFGPTTAMATTKQVHQNLQTLHASLEQGLSVAQEGVFSRIGNAVERMFTSNDKIVRTLPAAIAELKQFGGKSDLLKDVAWARIFRTRGPVVSASDAHALVAEMKKFHHDSVEVMNKFEAILREAQRALSSSRFIAKDEEVQRIKSLTAEANELLAQTRDSTQRYIKGKVDVHPLTVADAESLSHDVTALIEDRTYMRAVEKFDEAVSSADFRTWLEAQTRVMGYMAADIRAYVSLLETGLRPVYWLLAEVGNAEHLITYGVYKWINKSANK